MQHGVLLHLIEILILMFVDIKESAMSLLTAAEKTILATGDRKQPESTLCDEMVALANEYARSTISKEEYFARLRLLGRISMLMGIRYIGSPTKTLLKLWQRAHFLGFEDAKEVVQAILTSSPETLKVDL
jgi:hypothetical protein